MKKWLRIVCLTLVLACIFPALVACNDTPEGDGGHGTEGLEKPDTIDGTTYNGSNFTIFSVEDMFEKKYFFADKSTGDGMNDSLYMRKRNVENVLKVNLVYKAAEGSGSEAAFERYAQDVQNAIAAGDTKYQLVLTHAYIHIPTLIKENALKDFKELQSINVNKDYWNKDIMDQVSYKGHYYLGYSDFNLAATYVVAFNKSTFENFKNAFDVKNMYEYVDEGKWTILNMAECAQRVYTRGSNVSDTSYGLTGEIWVPFCGFIHSSGESVITQNNAGQYSISWYQNETVLNKMNRVTNTLKQVHELPETYFWLHPAHNNNVEPERVTLDTGRAFMQLMKTNDLIQLRNKNVKYGVLPYPMYNEEQYKTTKYRSLNWAGYLAVPSNNVSNAKMVSDVIECLSFYSKDVETYYYEKLLGLKVSDSPDDTRMLDIVWNSLCSDFGIVYSMTDTVNLDTLVYSIPHSVMGKNNVTFTGLHGKHTEAAQTIIDKELNGKS